MKKSTIATLSLAARSVLVVLALGFTAFPAQAHGIWFAQRSDDLALIYGEGGDDLNAAKRLPLVRQVTGYDASGKALRTSLSASGKLAVVDLRESPAVVAAVLDNGIWTKSADGKWHKKPKGEVANAVRSSLNYKYAVHLLAPLKAPLAALPGHQLQLLPQSDLPQLRGEILRLKVLFQGKPLAGAQVVADFVNDPDAEPLLSGPDGIVEVAVRNQGLNVIAVHVETPPPDAQLTDEVEHIATLSFRLKHAPE